MKHILPSQTLTVIIRDDGPFVHMQEPCTYRTVHIELTDNQLEKLKLLNTYQVCGTDGYESICKCFLEEIER